MIDPTTEFGRLLRCCRWNARFTLKELSGLLGCSVGYLCDVELGRKPPPSVHMLVALEECLDTHSGQLLDVAAQQRSLLPSELSRMLKETSTSKIKLVSLILYSNLSEEKIEKLSSELVISSQESER